MRQDNADFGDRHPYPISHILLGPSKRTGRARGNAFTTNRTQATVEMYEEDMRIPERGTILNPV